MTIIDNPNVCLKFAERVELKFSYQKIEKDSKYIRRLTWVC